MVEGLLAQYAEEIEASLLFRGIDLFDWYRGEMSSRRLLLLLRYLPDDSPFKIAYRDGDWPLQDHLTTGVWNEIKAMRGDLWAFLGKERLPFRPILPPSTERAEAEKLKASRAAHDNLIAQLRGER